jgi:hypothetical protein
MSAASGWDLSLREQRVESAMTLAPGPEDADLRSVSAQRR